MENKKYYYIDSNIKAMAIAFALGRDLFVIESPSTPGKTVYRFVDDIEFREALTVITNLRKKNNKYFIKEK